MNYNARNFLTENFGSELLSKLSTDKIELSVWSLSLVVLFKTNDAAKTLRAVVQEINNISNPKLRIDLSGATAIIAGLVLDKQVILELIPMETIRESEFYQEIFLEGQAISLTREKTKGLVEGEVKVTNQIALNMLHSGISIDLIAQFTGLTLEQVQNLEIA